MESLEGRGRSQQRRREPLPKLSSMSTVIDEQRHKPAQQEFKWKLR
jgi:hypothetical protein